MGLKGFFCVGLSLFLFCAVGKELGAEVSGLNITSITPSTNSIYLSWTNPEIIVDYYEISYKYAIIECSKLPDGHGNGSVLQMNGSISSYTITNLMENTNYSISIRGLVDIEYEATSAEAITSTLVAAPSVAPELSVTSITSTNVSLAWEEVPCLERNGNIGRYIMTYCLASTSSCTAPVITSYETDRNTTITGLIPRKTYIIKIRAVSIDAYHNVYFGPFSHLKTVNTSIPEAVGFYLKGRLYPGNVSLPLEDIGSDDNALMCLTNLVQCCRAGDTIGSGSLGHLKFPNGSLLPSKATLGSTNTISRTRGPSSLLLHRKSTALSPTGIYTCEVPDDKDITVTLYVYLYSGKIPDLSTTLEYSQSSSSVTCTSRGGIIDTVKWMINGSDITSNGRFSQTVTLTNRTTAIFQAILSDNMINNLIGNVTCEVTDGNGRTSSAMILINATKIDPTISGAIIGYPINNDFYTGLQLNLTCFITIFYTRYSHIKTVDVEAEWSRSSTVVNSNNDRTVVELFSMGSRQYQTSILFNSLDKTTDEGDYVCRVTAMFTNERNEKFIKKEETFYTLKLKTTFFQLLLTGISNCETWKDDNPLSKDMDIEKSIIKVVNGRCECEFTADRLTDRVFICDPGHPHSVIYQAQLHGTSQANVSRLTDVFLQWLSSDDRFIPVQLSLLQIERFCVVSSNTQSLCGKSQSPKTHEVSVLYLGAGIGAAALLIIFIILFTIVIACCVILRRRKVCLEKSNNLGKINAAQIDCLETSDCHFYEDIGKYHSSCNDQYNQDLNIETTTFKGCQDFGISACPAYISLPSTNKPDIAGDRDYDIIPQ